MIQITLLVLTVVFNIFNGEPNFACTRLYGGYCSASDTCCSLGGQVEKLSVKCEFGKSCCKCTDQCPRGSTCISESRCNGKMHAKRCCGNRVCCTPSSTTTTESITTTTPATTTPSTTIDCSSTCIARQGLFCSGTCRAELFGVDCCGQKCCRS